MVGLAGLGARRINVFALGSDCFEFDTEKKCKIYSKVRQSKMR